MESLAYKPEEYPNGYRDERPTELLDGKIVAMSNPFTNHVHVARNLTLIFGNYLRSKSCKVFPDLNLHLTKSDRLRPDLMVVCKPDIIRNNGVHGAPELIVEILSKGTAHRDKGYKKDLYEKCGIKEYWIVDTQYQSIEIHTLISKKYQLIAAHTYYNPDEIEEMDDKEKTSLVHEFKTPLFEDLVIRLEDIFQDVQ
ncbi:MAG: Uma2 family endonuclease [Defluviitaleaceae bacterium]|nr:Uma2 family endonuclease [Defluviitaleaceae bacterium]